MLVGKEFGPYLVDKELGAGAMGTVYRGRHRETGAKVAIKLVAPGLAASDLAASRFKREHRQATGQR
jgi:serine/threonine protein kinase